MIKTMPTDVEDIPLILVADDDRSLRALLKLAMEEEGYEVVEAKNGEDCLAEYTRLQPDMVLLDAVMPDMDGFTCCQHLRNLPSGDRIPILTITVLDDPESVDRAFAAGATDYITKPIHWAVLSQRVRRLLFASRALLRAEAAIEKLQKQQAWEYLFRNILQQLSQSSDLGDVLPRILEDLRHFFQVERVVFYQQDNKYLLESVSSVYPSILGLEIEYIFQYSNGQIVTIEDIRQTDLPKAILDQFTQLKIQALSIAPVMIQDRFWGSLSLHYCQSPRHWDKLEIERFYDLVKLLEIVFANKTFCF